MSPKQAPPTGSGTPSLIDALGAALPTRNASARSTAALLSNPGCTRRAVLDAARVDLAAVAGQLGSPAQFGQSPFAIGQGNRFERRIKEDGYAPLIEVIDGLLGIFKGIDSLRTISLEQVPVPAGTTLIKARAEATADVLVAIASGAKDAPHVVDHGVTSLDVGGSTVYLEQDALAFREGERLRICEVKGFPIIDGTANASKVGAAARQTAVYVASIQDTLAGRGLDPMLVSEEVVLICPRNFSVQPTAVLVDVGRELRALRRQLRRRAGIGALLALIEDDDIGRGVDLTTLLARLEEGGGGNADTLREVIEQLPYLYSPECLSDCDMARHCRGCAEAADDPARLGGEVASLLGDIASVTEAVALADEPNPSDDVAEVAALLASAKRAIADALEEAP